MNILGYLFTIGEFLPAMKVGYFHCLSFFLSSGSRIRAHCEYIQRQRKSCLPRSSILLQICTILIVLFQNVVGKCIQTKFLWHVYTQKIFIRIHTNTEKFKTKGVQNVSTNTEILKKASPSTREPSSSGREHLTHSGRNWQELGSVQNQPFFFWQVLPFPGSDHKHPSRVCLDWRCVFFSIYVCVCVCLWSTCLFVCACLWPSSMIILYFCKCLTHVLKGLQWMLTDEKSRADFTKFGFGDPDEIISQRWITFVF